MSETISTPRQPLKPGSTIGILGGGQLGRMLSVAASWLGYHVHIYCPEADSPAAEVSKHCTTAAYDDEDALSAFAEAVDVVTLEFENIPLAAAHIIEKKQTLAPSSEVLDICQHRVREKDFINSCDIATAPYAHITSLADAERAIETIKTTCILKTCTMGYDGKGQVKIDDVNQLAEAWESLGSQDVVMEGFVPFEKEASIIVARNQDGQSLCYPIVENIHKNHILHQTIAPATIGVNIADEAERIATKLANQLNLIGIMAVELFVLPDGSLRVNELAPRPHNSGHWTMDACQTCQFELAIRAVCGLPLLPVNQHSNAVMTNLIGDDIDDWKKLTSDLHSSVHFYGKKESKPGRKMGHVTTLTALTP